MSRGNDLLFNPPLLLKQRGNLKEIKFNLGAPKGTAFPLQGAVGSSSGKLLFLQELGQEEFSLIESGPSSSRGILRRTVFSGPFAITALGPEGFLAAESSGGLVENISLWGPKNKKENYPWNMPGDLLYCYATPEAIYTLWRDESSLAATGRSTTHLSGIGRDDPYPEWQDIFLYPGGSLRMEERGEKSFVIYDEDSQDGEIISLMTLGRDGPGEVYPLTSDAARAIRRGLYTYPQVGERMLTPGQKDGQYYYIDVSLKRSIDLRFLDLASGKDELVARLAQGPEAVDEFLLFQERIKLRSDGSHLAILLPRELQLFSEEGFVEKIALERDYNEINFSSDRITLFCSGKENYRQVTIS